MGGIEEEVVAMSEQNRRSEDQRPQRIQLYVHPMTGNVTLQINDQHWLLSAAEAQRLGEQLFKDGADMSQVKA